MGEINKINVSLLKSLNQDFKKEMNNFNNKAFDTFSNSYINKCSDPIIIRMKNTLNIHYNKIKKGYKNIDSWWNNYNNNIESVENYLSGSGGLEQIQESCVKAAAGALPLLEVNSYKSKGSIHFSKTANRSNIKSFDIPIQNSINKINVWWKDNALPTINIANKNIVSVTNKTEANITNGFKPIMTVSPTLAEAGVTNTKSVGNGIGYISGLVVLSMASSNTIYESNVKNAQNNSLTNICKDMQLYVNEKKDMVSKDGLDNQIINGISRATLNFDNSEFDQFMKPLSNTSYKKGYYDELGKYIEYYFN